jgi:hypothetical protein
MFEKLAPQKLTLKRSSPMETDECGRNLSHENMTYLRYIALQATYSTQREDKGEEQLEDATRRKGEELDDSKDRKPEQLDVDHDSFVFEVIVQNTCFAKKIELFLLY